MLTDLSHKEVRGRVVLSLSKGVDVDINGLAHDSRQVWAGDLFVAVSGGQVFDEEFLEWRESGLLTRHGHPVRLPQRHLCPGDRAVGVVGARRRR